MSSIWWLTTNILKINTRQIGVMISFFLLPVCGMVFSLLVYRQPDPDFLKIGIIDDDQSRVSRDLIQSICSSSQVQVIRLKKVNIKNCIASGEVDCVIRIPATFGISVIQQSMRKIDLISVKGASVTAWVKNDLQSRLRSLWDIAAASGGDSTLFNQIYQKYHQNRTKVKTIKVRDRSVNQGMTAQSIGFLIVFMMNGVGSASELILREKRDRTFYRVCGTLVTARTYLLGNVLATLILVMTQIGLTLVVFRTFGMATGVPMLQLFLLLTLCGLVAIGLGLVIVAFSKDTFQASTLQNLIIFPTCLLTGCYWPNDLMPEVMQRIADFLPQSWELKAIRILQAGRGFDQITVHVGIILAFALTFFMVAAYRFGRNDEVKTFV